MFTRIKTKTFSAARIIFAQIKQELIIQMSYPVDFFGIVLTALFIGLWFISFALAVTGSKEGSNFSNIAIMGLIMFFFYSQALWSIARFVRRQQLQGTLESVWLSPSDKFLVIIGSGFGGFVIMFVAVFCMVLGFLIFVPISFGSVWLGVIVLLISLAQSIGFGLFYGALLIKVKQANALMNLIQFSTMVLSAVFFPFSVFPSWLLWICRLYPFSWAVDAFRVATGSVPTPELIPNNVTLFGFLSPFAIELIILTVVTLILLVSGFFLFKRAIRKAMQEGTLSQY
ncbi:MAG: ABC transporter permease [Candidatus Heimdallarchaeaceae archaeon]